MTAWVGSQCLPFQGQHSPPTFSCPIHSAYPRRLARLTRLSRPLPSSGWVMLDPSRMRESPQPLRSIPFSVPEHLKGLNETAPLYALLFAAQCMPFVVPSRGNLVDIVYFSATALSLLVIGCKRSPLHVKDLSASLGTRQAALAPIVASVMLSGMYLLLKYTAIDIGLVINFLTALVGGICLKEALDPIFYSLFTSLNVQNVPLATEPAEKQASNNETHLASEPIRVSDLLSTALAGVVVTCYIFRLLPAYSFVLSNAIAIGIAARVLALVRPDSFLVAAGLLSGLCLYDIFWVFGSNVMVTVATKVDSPGKLLFPRDPSHLASAASYPFAVLGLGDIVVPGIYVSLALALDANIVQKQLNPDMPAIVPAGPYFKAALVAYALGLGTCFGANFATGAAQPALLYLVPALISSTLIVGLQRGELKDVLRFRMPQPIPAAIPLDTEGDAQRTPVEIE